MIQLPKKTMEAHLQIYINTKSSIFIYLVIRIWNIWKSNLDRMFFVIKSLSEPILSVLTLLFQLAGGDIILSFSGMAITTKLEVWIPHWNIHLIVSEVIGMDLPLIPLTYLPPRVRSSKQPTSINLVLITLIWIGKRNECAFYSRRWWKAPVEQFVPCTGR